MEKLINKFKYLKIENFTLFTKKIYYIQFKFFSPLYYFYNRSFAACVIAELVMVCPGSGARGLVKVPISEVDGQEVFMAFILSEVNLLMQVASTKLKRRAKNFTFQKSLIYNITIYSLFVILTLIMIV